MGLGNVDSERLLSSTVAYKFNIKFLFDFKMLMRHVSGSVLNTLNNRKITSKGGTTS